MLLLTIDLSPKEAKKSKVNAILYAPAVGKWLNLVKVWLVKDCFFYH